jgi:general stress protein CsbA
MPEVHKLVLEGRFAMSALMSSVKHARYVMGSLTAVLFAASAGGAF